MSMVYESEPFTVEAGTMVEISPIEVKAKSNKGKNITNGILYKNGSPAENYILKIFKVTKNGRNVFAGFTFTDSFGRFMIPLPSGDNYIVRVYSLAEEIGNIQMEII